MIEVVREARKAERSASRKQSYGERFPVLAIIREKGGVRVGSFLDRELRAMGVTPKTHPGLFKKDGGLGDVDNLVRGEEDVFSDLPADANDYVDPNAIFEAIRSELSGFPLKTEDQIAAEQTLENLSQIAEDWLESVGLDANATVGQVREFIRRVAGAEREVDTLDERVRRLETSLEEFDRATDRLVNERAIKENNFRQVSSELRALEDEIDAMRDLANASPRVGLIVDYATAKKDLFQKRVAQQRLQKRVDALRRLEADKTARVEHLAELTAKEADLEQINGEIDGLTAKVEKLEPMVPRIRRELPDFVSDADRLDYIEQVTNDIFNQLTGRARVGALTYDMTVAARGPLKERTFNIPDELVEEFLEDDIELIARRYARVMSADVELARMSRRHGFSGSPDLKDMLESVQNDYRRMREEVMASEMDEAAKQAELRRLGDRERSDITDIEGIRDILRGQYRLDIQHTNFARVVNAAQLFNFMRSMGGVMFSSLADAVRPAMTHGFLRYMGEGVLPLVTNLKAVKMSVEDARLLGAVTERVLQSRIATMAELADPYAMNSPFERFLQNGANIFSKMTLLPWWNDVQKSITSVLVQNRILKNVLADFDSLPDLERQYMGFVGIDADMAQRVRKMFDEFGQIEGGVHIPNIERWTDEGALRAYSAAVNKDVDGVITTKGAGDVPLFMHTPGGRALFQFKSFAIASNQRVLMRGLQEGPSSILTGLIGMTALGMLVYWLKQVESGRDVTNNLGTWIAEGMDRAGYLSVAFEINNTWEKLGGPGIYSIAAWAGKQINPEADERQPASRYAVRDAFGALLGPTFGLGTDTATAGGIFARALQEQQVDLTGGDVGTLRRLTPFASLPYWRWIIDGSIVPAAKEAVQ
jgi:hypothetical protein